MAALFRSALVGTSYIILKMDSELVKAFGELAKPIDSLINRASDAIGCIARPWVIVRDTKADAQAKIIQAENAIEIAELKQRAFERMVKEQIQFQRNIESVIGNTSRYINKEWSAEKIDLDLLSFVLASAKSVNDVQIQLLWSKLIAGEGEVPNSYSKRLAILLNSLQHQDALRIQANLSRAVEVLTKEESILCLPSTYSSSWVYGRERDDDQFIDIPIPDRRYLFELGLLFETEEFLEISTEGYVAEKYMQLSKSSIQGIGPNIVAELQEGFSRRTRDLDRNPLRPEIGWDTKRIQFSCFRLTQLGAEMRKLLGSDDVSAVRNCASQLVKLGAQFASSEEL